MITKPVKVTVGINGGETFIPAQASVSVSAVTDLKVSSTIEQGGTVTAEASTTLGHRGKAGARSAIKGLTMKSDSRVIATAETNTGTGSQAMDENALSSIYGSTTGSNWSNNSGWSNNMSGSLNGGSTPYGIQTELIGGEWRVTRVDLYNNNLAGQLPSQIGNLDRCRYFNVKFNSLSGSIPSTIGGMSDMEFFILSGRTYALGGHTKEPPSLTDIENGYAYHPGKRRSSTNNFSGVIPSEIGNMTNLLYLEIADNINLKGPIPSTIGNLSNLYGLALSQNDFSGYTLPPEIGNLNELRHLYITDAQLGGDIPSSYSNLTKLTSISLGQMKNDLPGNDLTGPFPDWSNCYQLYDIWISQNSLSGAFPLYFNNGNFSKLRHLQVAWNNLTGDLPNFNNCPSLIQLAAYGMNLDGDIGFINTLPSRMQIISLGANNLVGQLPTSGYPNWSQMKTIYLNNNNFTGPIPCAFWEAIDEPDNTRMQFAHLQNNNFSSNCTTQMNQVTSGCDIRVGGNNF